MNQATPLIDNGNDQPTHIMPIDVEHGGIRLALPLLVIVNFVIIYLAVSSLLAAISEETGCLALLISAAGALIVAALIDQLLKRLWPSGRSLAIRPEGIELLDRRKQGKGNIAIRWEQRINVLAWRFTVKRGSARIPKGWIMLGCQLLQDEAQMILYTFAPTKEADEGRYQYFTQLALREVLNKGEMPLREANKQRRLLRLEDERWQDGCEMRRADFALLIDTLSQHNPNWQDLA